MARALQLLGALALCIVLGELNFLLFYLLYAFLYSVATEE